MNTAKAETIMGTSLDLGKQLSERAKEARRSIALNQGGGQYLLRAADALRGLQVKADSKFEKGGLSEDEFRAVKEWLERGLTALLELADAARRETILAEGMARGLEAGEKMAQDRYLTEKAKLEGLLQAIEQGTVKEADGHFEWAGDGRRPIGVAPRAMTAKQRAQAEAEAEAEAAEAADNGNGAENG